MPHSVSFKALPITEPLLTYLRAVSLRETDLMRRLREETARLPNANMQIAPEQGQFMALLVELIGAKKCLELGVFTGYSSLAVAQALPEDGRIIACDVSEEWTSVARQYWAEAGMAHKVDLRLAPGQETLNELLREGERGTFDFAFLDADKAGYLEYYEKILELLRPGGLLMVDNVLWSGSVADESIQDETTLLLRAFNQHLANDARVTLSILPIADGITLARKRMF